MSAEAVKSIKNKGAMPVKVANLVWVLKSGGIESVSINNFIKMDRNKVSMDFIVDIEEPSIYDDVIESLRANKIGLFTTDEFARRRFYKLKKAKKLYFLLKQGKYDVVYNNLSFPSTLMYGMVAKVAGVKKVISHAHSTPPENLGKIRLCINTLQGRLFTGFSDTNISVSEGAGKWMYGRRKFKVIPNGIDFRKFEFSENKRKEVRLELGIDEDEVLLGNIGRLSTQKNQEFLLEVLNCLSYSDIKLKLLIVGVGELEEKLKSRADELNISDRVVFYGYSSHSEDILSAMDIFLFPSVWEGFGIAAIEAQANGLSTIMSNNVPESVKISNKAWRIPLIVSDWRDLIIKLIDSKTIEKRKEYTINRTYQIDNVAKSIESEIVSE